jgi:hypothetical protein
MMLGQNGSLVISMIQSYQKTILAVVYAKVAQVTVETVRKAKK